MLTGGVGGVVMGVVVVGRSGGAVAQLLGIGIPTC